MKSLLLATKNAHKTRELAQLLGQEFEVHDLNTEPGLPEIEETGATFAENAELKALGISKLRPNEFVVADDSGLEVDALGGAPGVFSARYAGEGTTDTANIAKLLAELEQRESSAEGATARFRCVLVLARAGRLLMRCEGVVEGKITKMPRGENGFGYDPVFVPEGFTETFAELPAEIKNRLSHRAQAAAKLQNALSAKSARPNE